MNRDVDRLGDAIGEVYEETRNELNEYTEGLTGGELGGSPGHGASRSRPIGLGQADIGRIFEGQGGQEDEFFDDVPEMVGRRNSLQDEPIEDEEAPEYEDVDEEPTYVENEGGQRVDIDVDNPNTTKGKVVSIVYLCIMFLVLLFGLNTMISLFQSKENPEDTFDLNQASDQLRGIDKSSEEQTFNEMDKLIGWDDSSSSDSEDALHSENTLDSEDDSNEGTTVSTDLVGSNDISTDIPLSDTSLGAEVQASAGKSVGNVASENINDSYASVDELREVPLNQVISYSIDTVKYLDYEGGLAQYTYGNRIEKITGTVFEAVPYVQLDESGIVFKSPVSKRYLYCTISQELLLKAHKNGVATIRIYMSEQLSDEVFADVIAMAAVVEKRTDVNVEGEIPEADASVGQRESITEEEAKAEVEEKSTLFD